jgi:hypothetical protein
MEDMPPRRWAGHGNLTGNAQTVEWLPSGVGPAPLALCGIEDGLQCRALSPYR